MKEKTKRERPSWDEYFIGILLQTTKRSSCLKMQVGAIIVSSDREILTTGYNGAPRGIESCFEKNNCWRRQENIGHGKEKDLCMASHAEANAVYQAARKGISLLNSSIYVTTYPCPTCAKAIIQTGIKEIIYLEDYYGKQYDFSQKLLKKANIKIRKLKPKK